MKPTAPNSAAAAMTAVRRCPKLKVDLQNPREVNYARVYGIDSTFLSQAWNTLCIGLEIKALSLFHGCISWFGFLTLWR